MKKLFYCLFAAAFAAGALCGCSDKDDDPVRVVPESVTLKSGEEYQLDLGNDILDYSSENEYIASISEKGLITGRTIGTTQVKASYNGGEIWIPVTVEPRYNFVQPYMEWGEIESTVIGLYGEPDSRTTLDNGQVVLTYLRQTPINPTTQYMFSRDWKLSGAAVTTKAEDMLKWTEFLLERYLPIEMSPDGSEYYFVNGLRPETITLVIMLQPLDASTYMTVYVPYTGNEPTGVRAAAAGFVR